MRDKEFEIFADQNKEFLNELSKEGEGQCWDSGIGMEEVSELEIDAYGQTPMIQHQSHMVQQDLYRFVWVEGIQLEGGRGQGEVLRRILT